jgi:ubiquinone/menaquinone biosynthesis C-methylase UbiE
MLVHRLQHWEPSRKFIYKLGEPRAVDTIGHFKKYLRKGEPLLDMGTGMGNIAKHLQQQGYPTTPLDIDDLSFTPGLHPVVYDGHTMPFKNKQFDSALVLTVLHHIPREQHKQILKESMRVANRLIIIKDIHSSTPHKYVTMFVDSLLNLEFRSHPHSNKTDAEWRAVFKRHGLKLVGEKPIKSFGVMRHGCIS